VKIILYSPNRRFLKKDDRRINSTTSLASKSSVKCHSTLTHSLQSAKNNGKVHLTDQSFIDFAQYYVNCEVEITSITCPLALSLALALLTKRKNLLNLRLVHLNDFLNILLDLYKKFIVNEQLYFVRNLLEMTLHYESNNRKLFRHEISLKINIKPNHLPTCYDYCNNTISCFLVHKKHKNNKIYLLSTILKSLKSFRFPSLGFVVYTGPRIWGKMNKMCLVLLYSLIDQTSIFKIALLVDFGIFNILCETLKFQHLKAHTACPKGSKCHYCHYNSLLCFCFCVAYFAIIIDNRIFVSLHFPPPNLFIMRRFVQGRIEALGRKRDNATSATSLNVSTDSRKAYNIGIKPNQGTNSLFFILHDEHQNWHKNADREVQAVEVEVEVEVRVEFRVRSGEKSDLNWKLWSFRLPRVLRLRLHQQHPWQQGRWRRGSRSQRRRRSYRQNLEEELKEEFISFMEEHFNFLISQFLFNHFIIDIFYLSIIFCLFFICDCNCDCKLLNLYGSVRFLEYFTEIFNIRGSFVSLQMIFKCSENEIKLMTFGKPKNSTRLVLVINLEERFLTSIPMKPKSCETSLYWLCRQILILNLNRKKTHSYNYNSRLLDSLSNSTLRSHTYLDLNYMVSHKLDSRHTHIWIEDKLCHDIEVNPGPVIVEDVNKKISVITLNCRGLGKIDKLRLTLKKAAQILIKNPNSIILLQEMMIKTDSYLKLAWKGTFAITYGNGNSQGCITLASSNFTFTNQINLESRGHYIEIEGLMSKKVAVLNIYAPTGYATDKKDFFIDVINKIESTQCEDIVMAGDFNLTFSSEDRLRRNTCAGEVNLAKYVSESLDRLGMEDTWRGFPGMTWKRGNVMSHLDRIYARFNAFRLISVTTDWTLCDSDHAMVQADFLSHNKRQKGPRICRLNPNVVLDNESLLQLRGYLSEQLASLSETIDPHMRLEFAKMTIRTKAMELGKKLQNTEMNNLKLLDDDIKYHERLFAETTSAEELEELGLHLERQTIERNRILESQGKNLAWKARTKWYNEGERSNKYFLNLLKNNAKKTEMENLLYNGQLLADPQEIGKVVNQYYANLYNKNTQEVTDNDSFLNKMFTVDAMEANLMNEPIMLNELWAALKPLKDTAPGPDAISHIYMKKLWDILGPLILDAWIYSLQNNKMPPSHERSYLRLIPKAGKDSLLLNNWRPITLSNCDHKLITRVYNTRLIKILGKYITSTQTAYIKNRNITDNIRLINSAIQLANCEPGTNGSVLALDAQKAFDSVNHRYLSLLLETIGLNSFVPIFELLYQDLVNDMVINGHIVGNHSVRNGVKQGDALSCTLFILAIEPLIRNIESNTNIRALNSTILQFQWPKVLGYADDITCLMKNDVLSKQAVFTEYERFSKISGLILNADKTEMYDFADVERPNNINGGEIKISYMGKEFRIQPVKIIKINGLLLCKNMQLQKKSNCEILMSKMERHFANWSKRGLSLLGKIQIYKTYGLSQFLYHLAIIEPDEGSWKEINNKISKFIWNKNYSNNQAPSRIKREILLTPVSKGGFGLVDLKEVVTALRLKRHFYLLEHEIHPLASLISALLEGTDYLSAKPELNIDDITSHNLSALLRKRLSDCVGPDWQLESDLHLHSNLIYTKVNNIARPRKRQSAEMAYLRRNDVITFADAISNGGRSLTMLLKIAQKELTRALRVIADRYRGEQLPAESPQDKLKDTRGRWVRGTSLTSKMLRETLFCREATNPKIILIEDEIKTKYYINLSKLINTNSKSRILRLLYGDVYCGERLVKFGLSEVDSCRRCFERESIMHLLLECPYTRAVYQMLGIDPDNPIDVLGADLHRAALEIRCDLINYLVFQQKIVPPRILVKSTLEKFSNGLANKPGIIKCAENMLKRIFGEAGQES
jgi:hypothetical protein